MRRRSAAIGLLFAVGVVSACSNDSSGTDDAPTDTPAGLVGSDFHSLVADPRVTGRIYVGGHDAVERSDDSGASWVRVHALDHADAMGWAITDESIWVSGHPGLQRSLDGGLTFKAANSGLPNTDVHAFGAAHGTLYAAGPGLGVVVSFDDGQSWVTATTAVGQAFFGRIIVDPVDVNHLVAADARSGAMESNDGGRTWVSLGSQPALWVSSGDGLATLYVSGGKTAQVSSDGGTTWQSMVLPEGATLIEAGNDGALYAGVFDGNAVAVWFSADAGASWQEP